MSVEHDGPDDVRLIDVRVAHARGWTDIKWLEGRGAWYGVPPRTTRRHRSMLPSARGYMGSDTALELLLDMERGGAGEAARVVLAHVASVSDERGDLVDAIVAAWLAWREAAS